MVLDLGENRLELEGGRQRSRGRYLGRREARGNPDVDVDTRTLSFLAVTTGDAFKIKLTAVVRIGPKMADSTFLYRPQPAQAPDTQTHVTPSHHPILHLQDDKCARCGYGCAPPTSPTSSAFRVPPGTHWCISQSWSSTHPFCGSPLFTDLEPGKHLQHRQAPPSTRSPVAFSAACHLDLRSQKHKDSAARMLADNDCPMR